jgi:hypothetical protein
MPENIVTLRTAVNRSPRRSAIRHAIATNISDRSVRRMLHDELRYHPYKIQVVHQLLPRDRLTRMTFCEQMTNCMKTKTVCECLTKHTFS